MTHISVLPAPVNTTTHTMLSHFAFTPPTAPLAQFLIAAHGRCQSQPSSPSCAAPRLEPSRRHRRILDRLRAVSQEQKDLYKQAQAPTISLRRLYSLLHDDTPRDLFCALLNPGEACLRSPATGAAPVNAVDKALAQKITGELAIAISAPNDIVNAAIFGDFDFLALSRSDFPVSLALPAFSLELQRHSRDKTLDAKTASWAASMILRRLHPALARTDTPSHIKFHDAAYAKLIFAIDLMHAQGLDDAHYSYPQLIRFADIAIAGAKHDSAFGRTVRLFQLPAALWFAHANLSIDLRKTPLRDDGIAGRALSALDRSIVSQWRAEWSALKETLSSLRATLTPEQAVRGWLQSHGLPPDQRHTLPWYARQATLACAGTWTLANAILQGCPQVVAHRLGKRTSPRLEQVIARQNEILADKKNSAFATILEIALNKTDAQTQDCWRHDAFEIISPILAMRRTAAEPAKSATWLSADIGKLIATSCAEGKSRVYAVSANWPGWIQALDEFGRNPKPTYESHILQNPQNYFQRAAMGCAAPCDAMHFSDPKYSRSCDATNRHAVGWQDREGNPITASDCYNTRKSLPERLSDIAQGMNIDGPAVLAAAEAFKRYQVPLASRVPSANATLDDAGEKILSNRIAADHLQHAQSRLIASLPTAPIQRGQRLAQTLPEILRENEARGKLNSGINTHRLNIVRKPPDSFNTVLIGFLRTDASMENIASALERSQARLQAQALLDTPTPVFSPTPIEADSSQIGLRFHLSGVKQVGRVYASEQEAKGIFTFALDGNYYQLDIYGAHPRLRSFDSIQKDQQEAPLCREERGALKKNNGKSKVCPVTHTLEPDADGVQWQAFEHNSPGPGGFIQRDPIEGRLQQFPRYEQTLFRQDNEGMFAGRDLVIVDGIVFERNAHRSDPAGAASDPSRSVYEPVGEDKARGQGIPSPAPLPASMPGRLISVDGNRRPLIEYELRSVDGATRSQMSELSRIRTHVRRDFLSLPSEPGRAATGLVEIEENAYYQFHLPSLPQNGTAPVSLTRLDDPAAIARFTSQETAMEWMRTRPFRVQVGQEHTSFYIDVLQHSEAIKMAVDALEAEVADQRLFGDDSAVIGNALARCARNPADAPAADVAAELSTAFSHIFRSPSMTVAFRDRLINAYSLAHANFHFAETHIPTRVPSDTGVMAYVESELRRTLDLFSSIWAELDFSEVFAAAPGEDTMGRLSIGPNRRALAINDIFLRVFSTNNFAVAKVKLNDGTQIIYYAVSGARRRQELTLEVTRNPHRYIAVTRDAASAPSALSLPCLPNLTPTPLFTPQSREHDTERLIAARIVQDHRPDQVSHIEFISRLPICHSCAMVCIDLANRFNQSQLVFAGFPEMPKKMQRKPAARAIISTLAPAATAATATHA
jgi:hypothetical protein